VLFITKKQKFPLTTPAVFSYLEIGLKESDLKTKRMLRLSRKAEYGIIALKHILQKRAGQTCSAREIAEQYKIPVELMAKVLQKLAKDGLLQSAQGVHGGYVLAMPPSHISVADVVESIDGPIGIVECVVPDDECKCVQHVTGVCNISDPFVQIQGKFKSFLSGISLADLSWPKQELVRLS
jgi:Rrf2 family protein